MKLNLFEGIKGLENTLDFHLKRHSVLTSNLANSETPGYRPKDLVFKEVLDSANAANMTTTDSKHISSDSPEASASELIETETHEQTGDENGVRLERAMAQVAANRVRYDAALELTSRQLALLRFAATNGGE